MSAPSDWRRSPAHLSLLTHYLQPHAIEDWGPAWKAALAAESITVLRAWIQDSVLVRASLGEHLDRRWKIIELKQLLRGRGLKTSGNKAELIDRLIVSDTPGMIRDLHGLELYKCSEEASRLAENYVASARSERESAEQQTFELLRAHQLGQAWETYNAYADKLVVLQSMLAMISHGSLRYEIDITERVLRAKPKILGDVQPAKLEALRIAASMMLMWDLREVDRFLPPSFRASGRFDNSTAARMLAFYVHQQDWLNKLKAARTSEVTIGGMNDRLMCATCHDLQRRSFAIDHAPELPYALCTSASGCRCHYVEVARR